MSERESETVGENTNERERDIGNKTVRESRLRQRESENEANE